MSTSGPVQVMVVDDSAVVRGLITRMLEDATDAEVAVSVPNGDAALKALDRYDVDVVLLDIEMPVMDGMTALPLLLKKKPDLKIIMASTLTMDNADISLRAMELGAIDYIPKPTATREISAGTEFKRELVEKVVTLGKTLQKTMRRTTNGTGTGTGAGAGFTAARSVQRSSTQRAAFQRPSTSASAEPGREKRSSLLAPSAPIKLRQATVEHPDIVVIGSSTGGPQALFKVLTDMRKGGAIKQPILITQHMPATFTTILAEHITRVSGWEAAEAKDGEVIRGGRVYIAPGGFHMVIESKGPGKVIRITDDPPVNFCKPAVDPMFRSVAKVYGKKVLAVILTGMGADGSKGGVDIVNAGGTLIAQDEETSVVWGMPGAAAQTGACSAILPVQEIGAYVKKVATRH